MEEILKMLTDASVFYVATTDANKPKVRPFGFVMSFKERLYFCTGNQKDIYKQLKANPSLEICTMISKDKWVRISGKAVFDQSMEAKRQAFTVAPSLTDIYGTPENPIFEVFYLTDIAAIVYSVDKKIREIKA